MTIVFMKGILAEFLFHERGIVGIPVFMKVGILSEGAGAGLPGATVLGRLKGWLLGVLAMLAQ